MTFYIFFLVFAGLNVYLKTNIFANGEHVVSSIGDGCNVNLV